MLPHEIARSFKENLKAAKKLAEFDKEVQSIAIDGIQNLHDLLKKKGHENPQWNGERTLLMLKGMQDSPALQKRYELIYNQVIVLMVSYFASAVGDLFRCAAAFAVSAGHSLLLDKELKVKISELIDLKESIGGIGDLILRNNSGISFQDMQSTHRAFEEHFDISIPTDDCTRNIIAAQACRHSIVHDGARINERIVKQLRNARPRQLKAELKIGEAMKFDKQEIAFLSEEMEKYLDRLVNSVEKLEST